MENPKKEQITIKDIAKIAGVSHSTVSRSLNDSPLISEKTREKIKKLAEELDFEFNANARSLSTKKTNKIALILPGNYFDSRTSHFYENLTKNIISNVEKEGFDIYILTSHNSINKKTNIKKIIGGRQFDGLLICFSNISKKDFINIRESKIPHVFLHFYPEIYPKNDINFYGTDNFEGGYIAGKSFISQNLKKPLILSFEADTNEFLERTKGFFKAFEEENIMLNEKNIIKTDLSFEKTYKVLENKEEFLKNFDCIFAETDIMALAVLKISIKFNIKIPNDISLIGFDNIDIIKYSNISVSTIHQPVEKIAKYSVSKLVKLIKMIETKNEILLFKPKLILRESTGGEELE